MGSKFGDRPARGMTNTERIARIATGATLIALAVVVPTDWGWLGIYPLITGLMRTSPVFKMLGIGNHRTTP